MVMKARSAPLIPAIVLSWDRNRIFVEHMVRRYAVEWPGHPFEFHIPFQENDGPVAGARCRMIKTPPDIVNTVLTLLSGFSADTWVYWCIDDKYPLWLDTPFIARVARVVETRELSQVDGVLFSRVGPDRVESASAEALREVPKDPGNAGLGHLLLRHDWSRIWIHQFIRVGVLRALFAAMPRDLGQAKDMDEAKKLIPLPAGARLTLTRESHAVFGESASRGVITEGCLASLRALRMETPPVNVTPAPGIQRGHPVRPEHPWQWLTPRFLRAYRAGFT